MKFYIYAHITIYVLHCRPSAYPQTDVVIIGFSASSPASAENVKAKWLPEIRHHLPNTPIILVCAKVDLRHDRDTLIELRRKDMKPVTFAEGVKLAHQIGAYSYIETSTHEGIGTKEVFNDAARLHMWSNTSAKQNVRFGGKNKDKTKYK